MTQSRKQGRPFTAHDIARIIHMREVERRKWPQIDAALGRARGGCCVKYESLRRVKDTPRPCESGGRIHLSTDQVEDREARAAAAERMTATAVFFGDPPPGYSALDRRGGNNAPRP